jgi:hypothetical protein
MVEWSINQFIYCATFYLNLLHRLSSSSSILRLQNEKFLSVTCVTKPWGLWNPITQLAPLNWAVLHCWWRGAWGTPKDFCYLQDSDLTVGCTLQAYIFRTWQGKGTLQRNLNTKSNKGFLWPHRLRFAYLLTTRCIQMCWVPRGLANETN